MSKKSLVSIVVIFLNAEQYLDEAIESICSQTYEQWELLLVDDGSTDGSTEIARRYAKQRPGQIYYLAHPGHGNYGKGASRNLGIQQAQGRYLAFLDADDLWLSHKLEEQVAVLNKHEEAGMLYGETLYWYSWTKTPIDSRRDFVPPLGVPVNIPIKQPRLLSLYLRGKAAVPCTCSILVRRSLIDEIGGFDDSFTGVNNIYEDQAFYAKVCLRTPVVAINHCWDWYRQHPQASMAVARQTGKEIQAREFFLNWLADYLNEQMVQDKEVWLALERELWRIQKAKWLPDRMANSIRWAKKWLLHLEERTLPTSLSHRLWLRS